MVSQLDELEGFVDHFRARVLQDALASATSAYWLRRAATFEWAMPRPDDFTGRATPADIERRRRRLAADAQACRNAATVALLQTKEAA